jgi:hypothetical protein
LYRSSGVWAAGAGRVAVADGRDGAVADEAAVAVRVGVGVGLGLGVGVAIGVGIGVGDAVAGTAAVGVAEATTFVRLPVAACVANAVRAFFVPPPQAVSAAASSKSADTAVKLRYCMKLVHLRGMEAV